MDANAVPTRASVFVFTTRADVLPLAVMEAIASRVPMVTTRVGAIAEQIEVGVRDYLIPPGDVDSRVETTLRLATNPELRRTMGAAARRAAERLFNGSRNYSRVLTTMKGCIDQAAGASGWR